MTKLRLTMACGPYDRMEALFNGTVQVEGVELTPLSIQRPLEIFSRMLANDEFDIAEMSLSHCFILPAAGKARFVTLPVFPSRMFRHSFIYINRRAGIASPKDLAGRRIGVQGYQMTAAVWIRGLLRRDHGVDLDGVEWFEGGVNQPGVAGGQATAFRPAQALKISNIGDRRTLSDMLAAGEIDALIGADTPNSLRGSADVVRLFPNYHEVEREYLTRTGVFPIMHALVIREELYRRHRWLATSLYKACAAAKAIAQEQARYTSALKFMLPWLHEQLEELHQLFGGDHWPYGVAANRRALETFTQCLVDDHFLGQAMPLSDIFVPIEGVGAAS